MYFKKINTHPAIFIMISLLLAIPASIFAYQLEAGGQTPKISRDSINFLQRTGQAMAEIAEAVKPAVVNISVVKTDKITGTPFAPFYDDPFFRKFLSSPIFSKR